MMYRSLRSVIDKRCKLPLGKKKLVIVSTRPMLGYLGEWEGCTSGAIARLSEMIQDPLYPYKTVQA